MVANQRWIWLATSLLIFLTATAHAGGFNLYEQGVRASGMGGAFTATADNSSAIFYNPAGLGYLEGTVVDLNWSPIIPSSKFSGANPPTPAYTGETVNQSFSIPGIYVSHTLPSGWAFGAGLYAPFGVGVEWENPTTWIGRESSYDVDLATIYMTPAVAYKINPEISVSLGLDLAWMTIELNRFSTTTYGGNSEKLNTIDGTLKGTSDLTAAPCAGVLYRPLPKWSFGLMYHHNQTFKHKDGDATLTNAVPQSSDPGLEAVRNLVDDQIAAWGGPDHKVATEINLPHILSLAARHQVHERVGLEIDLVHWGWSNFEKVELVYDNDPDSPLNETIREEYKDVWQFRFGADIDLNPSWKGMLGYIYDKSPQPVQSVGPLLADADRHDFALGVQLSHKSWRFSGNYMAVLFRARSTVENGQVTFFGGSTPEEIELRTREAGTYDSLAHLFGLGVGYNF
jgi:long-chain fatty acid transport protein